MVKCGPKKYDASLQLGYGDSYAVDKADKLVGVLLEEEIETLQAKYPYSFNAQGALDELYRKAEYKTEGNIRFLKDAYKPSKHKKYRKYKDAYKASKKR